MIHTKKILMGLIISMFCLNIIAVKTTTSEAFYGFQTESSSKSTPSPPPTPVNNDTSSDAISVWGGNYETIYERWFNYDTCEFHVTKTVIYHEPDSFDTNPQYDPIEANYIPDESVVRLEESTFSATIEKPESNNELHHKSEEYDSFKDSTQEQRRQMSEEAEENSLREKQKEFPVYSNGTVKLYVIKEQEFNRNQRINLGDPYIFDSDIILKNINDENFRSIFSNPIIKARFERLHHNIKIKDEQQRRIRKYRDKELYKPQLKFFEDLLSGEVATLVERTKHPNLTVAEEAFNELKNLWPWHRDYTFLIPSRTQGTGESGFVQTLGINIIEMVERDLITRPDYITQHISEKSNPAIQELKNYCIDLQKEQDIGDLFQLKQKLYKNIIDNDKEINICDNISLALVEKTIQSPINTVLGRIKNAPSLEGALQEVRRVEKEILQYARNKNITYTADIKEKIIERYGFDVLQVMHATYRARPDYVHTSCNQSFLSSPLACAVSNIQSLKLPEAHQELLHLRKQVADYCEARNITDALEQQEYVTKKLGVDILALTQSTYKERPDFLNLMKLFKPVDVQSETIEILTTSNNYESVSRALENVAEQVLNNSRLCDLNHIPEIESNILDSLHVIRAPKNTAEFVFHTTVVDHLLTDLQSQADAIVSGERTVWERSPELLTRGIVTFVTALNPIQQAKDIGSLIEDCAYLAGKGLSVTADAILNPFDTAEKLALLNENACEFISNTARFTVDSITGLYYLSPEERSQRINNYWNSAGDIYKQLESQITAEQVVDITAHIAANVVFGKGIFKAIKYLKEIDVVSKLSKEAKLVSRGLKAAIEEHPAYATAEGVVLKMSDGMKDVGSKSNPIKSITKDVSKSGGRIMQENGKAFEDFLVKKLGGTGSFKMGSREFDGAVGNIWYEAKSGNYWEGLLASKEKLNRFQSTTGHCLKIAKDNGALFEIHSNSPIPQSIKNWLTNQQIPFTEWL